MINKKFNFKESKYHQWHQRPFLILGYKKLIKRKILTKKLLQQILCKLTIIKKFNLDKSYFFT